ncbi:hypothetical protein K435DRAFT_803159 [Dendrothele bispora CBS 962.96]|uniref:Uncharacterized protein n=1 Tax=Dendrothele bispora (strain CBS 962.96) TaxID=1314807 RepID=A0A4S8LIG2_DENBC|nr:hypothetical protein K435DRAFT_803159 [Dendrothele bispora CBS 962.96]
MSALPDRPTPVSQGTFATFYGGILICGFIAIFLYGISVLQMYMYFLNYQKDTRWIKLLVLLIGPDFIISYTDLSVLDSGYWTACVDAIMNRSTEGVQYIVVVLVQTDEGRNSETCLNAGFCYAFFGSYGTDPTILMAAFGLYRTTGRVVRFSLIG